MMRPPTDEIEELQADAWAWATRLLRIVIGVLFVVMVLDVAVGLVAFVQRALS
jgi:hypothetical protein